MHLPFLLFAVWLGGGLWWVCRRLFGNEGGFFALGLYCFCPTVIHYAVVPNNEVLSMWGLYGLVYAAMGVAHAMQGPRRKWKPRILLFLVALSFTAMAHLLAALLGFVASFAFLFYLAERRRSYVMQLLVFARWPRCCCCLSDLPSVRRRSATSLPAVRGVASGSRWTR